MIWLPILSLCKILSAFPYIQISGFFIV